MHPEKGNNIRFESQSSCIIAIITSVDSNFLIGESEKMGGALVVCLDQSNGLDVDVLWAHTTKSMVTAHMATYHSSPRVGGLLRWSLVDQIYAFQTGIH